MRLAWETYRIRSVWSFETGQVLKRYVIVVIVSNCGILFRGTNFGVPGCGNLFGNERVSFGIPVAVLRCI
jgi:hypothetical protein